MMRFKHPKDLREKLDHGAMATDLAHSHAALALFLWSTIVSASRVRSLCVMSWRHRSQYVFAGHRNFGPYSRRIPRHSSPKRALVALLLSG